MYGPTQDNAGTRRIKTNAELENFIQERKYCEIHKITKITMGCTCN
jgi:hypothetical protein